MANICVPLLHHTPNTNYEEKHTSWDGEKDSLTHQRYTWTGNDRIKEEKRAHKNEQRKGKKLADGKT